MIVRPGFLLERPDLLSFLSIIRERRRRREGDSLGVMHAIDRDWEQRKQLAGWRGLQPVGQEIRR